jgi:hypothetical protein
MGRTWKNTSKFDDVPAGTYEVELYAVEDRKGFENGKYDSSGKPRLAWLFRVLSGEHRGKTIEQNTGAEPEGPQSKLSQLFAMLLGRPLKQDEDVYEDDFVGRHFMLVWALNSKSEKGRNHIVALTPLPATPVGNGEAPPPPPKRLATPAASEGAEFWVLVEEGQPPVKKSRSALEEYVREGGLDPDALLVQEVGKATGWVPASRCGVQGPIPF